MSENSNNSLLALLAGVAIGAGLGILFAPDSGHKTRQKLKAGVDEYGDELQQQLQALNQKIRKSVADQGEQFSEQIDGLVSDASEETELMIGKLEAKLADLKERLAQRNT